LRCSKDPSLGFTEIQSRGDEEDSSGSSSSTWNVTGILFGMLGNWSGGSRHYR